MKSIIHSHQPATRIATVEKKRRKKCTRLRNNWRKGCYRLPSLSFGIIAIKLISLSRVCGKSSATIWEKNTQAFQCVRINIHPPKWKSILLLIYLFRFMLFHFSSLSLVRFFLRVRGWWSSHRRARVRRCPAHDIQKWAHIHIQKMKLCFMEKKYKFQGHPKLFKSLLVWRGNLDVVVFVCWRAFSKRWRQEYAGRGQLHAAVYSLCSMEKYENVNSPKMW